MDVVDVYLESILRQIEEAIFMKISQGRELGQSGLVCKILKSLYGLKQIKSL